MGPGVSWRHEFRGEAVEGMAAARPAGYDAIVIGAGVSGLYALLKLRELGLSTLVLEAGSGVGGTWYWNRHPGARFDSESYTYGYAFDAERLAEWEWSEHFSAQPETLRYLEHVADRFDLRRDIHFDSRVVSATWDEAATQWEVVTDDGSTARARWLLTAIGALSVPVMPRIEGMDHFGGAAFHTARWPHDGFDVTGLRVGVIGTGATGVHVIQEVAKAAAHLTVFQQSFARLLASKVDSWFHGSNANLPEKVKAPMIYAGGLPTYRERCEESAAAGYAGFTIT